MAQHKKPTSKSNHNGNGHAPITWSNGKRKLSDLIAWDENPATIDEPNAARLEQSLAEFGQIQTIAIDPRNKIIDGHQRRATWMLSQKFGKSYKVDVRIASRALTRNERQRLAILLRSGTVGQYNWDIVSAWDADLIKSAGLDENLLAQLNRDQAALIDLLASEQSAPPTEPTDPGELIDRAAQLQEKWQVQKGDLWQCGKHRILCGDSTNADDVARVMQGERAAMVFIDPPYNALKSWNKDEAHGETRLDPSKWFENDNMSWEDYSSFLTLAFANMQGHSAYVCCDFRIYPLIVQKIKEAGYLLKHCIVWKKNVWGLGKRYRFQHEFIVYACKKDAPFYGDRSQSDVWEIDIHKTTEHNTPKPVDLPMRAIVNSSEIDEIVLDLFCGSGTSIVAAEQTRRICYAMEKADRFCAVTLERLSLLGLECKLIEHAKA